MSQGPRALAVSFLEQLFTQSTQLDFLSERKDFSNLKDPDRRLATELVYGVLRNLSLLDYYIETLSRRPLERLEPRVRWILRVAMYQIEFLRIPDHAAVHESVELCRHFRQPQAVGFVNAVLRAFLRKKPALPKGPSAKALAIRYSHPEWLVRRYLSRYGLKSSQRLLQRNNVSPLPSVWVNTFKTTLSDFCQRLERESIDYQICSRVPNCVVVRAPGFSQHPLYREGFCFFMDTGSQQMAHLPDVAGCQTLGDFCCAPGGKCFLLASRKARGAKLYCCDVNFRRLGQAKLRAELYQVSGLHFVNADLRSSMPFVELFDFVLLDVPCSGSGTVRSNPDLRWKMKETDLQRFHSLQLSLLHNGYAALREGGDLFYVTCSTEPEENEQVIEEFLAVEKSAGLPDEFHRTFPDPHPGDCFFAAHLRKGRV